MTDMSLAEFIIKLGIKTEKEGQALWEIIANKELYIDDVRVITGSFRWNASVIASICGGIYMDYYCSTGRIEEHDLIMEKFIDFNVSTR